MPPPPSSSSRLGCPASSSAQMTPSSTHSLVRSARGMRASTCLHARIQRVAAVVLEVRPRALDRRQRAHALPGELERPARPARDALGLAREHRLVLPRRPGGPILGGAHDQPVALLAAEVGGHERPLALQLAAVQDHRQRAVGALALRARRCRDPRPRPSRRRTRRPGSRPRSRRSRAGGPRRAPRASARRRAAARPAAAPSSAARRRARAGSRSAGARAEWRCTTNTGAFDVRFFLRPALERLGRLARVALGAVFLEISHGR